MWQRKTFGNTKQRQQPVDLPCVVSATVLTAEPQSNAYFRRGSATCDTKVDIRSPLSGYFKENSRSIYENVHHSSQHCHKPQKNKFNSKQWIYQEVRESLFSSIHHPSQQCIKYCSLHQLVKEQNYPQDQFHFAVNHSVFASGP